jgi:hypothetical protein
MDFSLQFSAAGIQFSETGGLLFSENRKLKTENYVLLFRLCLSIILIGVAKKSNSSRRRFCK